MNTPVPAPTPLAARAEAFFRRLQEDIIKRFEQLEGGATFTRKPWQKPAGESLQGGGVMATMHGKVFEKVGVNFSCVGGRFSEKFANEIPGATDSGGQFWASGVSLVAHMANPRCPSVHFNVRRIETGKSWFGGGADLTPTFEYAEDTAHFHNTLKAACDGYREGAYAEYKKWCDEYFFIPHRNEARGVGGIFFDYVNTDPEADFAFVQAVGAAFLQAFTPLVEKRRNEAFSEADKEAQLIKRGRYAEFNLLYDRGTRFGLQTGGNVEAILMSLPPMARWP
ncbi:MAG TPA: oxygen-dependent coproporphyrinogen oxidase [Alphaproteobacteria bacterium]|nr:oxygen-dependent coproporphyrinogen oxidase [Alphaproteobacteria bacterium]